MIPKTFFVLYNRYMKILFLLMFIVSSTVHLYASYNDNKPLRNKTKAFILIGIMGFYCFSVETVNVFLILAVFFSWAGDVLLIPKGVKWFTAGGICFMISHFFFIMVYYKHVDFSTINPFLIILVAGIYSYLVIRVFTRLKPHLPKALFYPMAFYFFLNGAMNAFAFFQLCTLKNFGALLTFIGAICFFMSDGTLFFVRFKKNHSVKHNHFPVMLTYIAAEFLIVYGQMLIE